MTFEQQLTCEEQLEATEERCRELEEALKQANLFRTAKDMQGPKIWLPVISLLEIFHKAYQIRNNALSNNKPSTKLMFTISNEGRIIGVNAADNEETEG